MTVFKLLMTMRDLSACGGDVRRNSLLTAQTAEEQSFKKGGYQSPLIA